MPNRKDFLRGLPGHIRQIDRRGGDDRNTFAVIAEKSVTKGDARLGIELAASYKTRRLLPSLQRGRIAKQVRHIKDRDDTDAGTKVRIARAFRRRDEKWRGS